MTEPNNNFFAWTGNSKSSDHNSEKYQTFLYWGSHYTKGHADISKSFRVTLYRFWHDSPKPLKDFWSWSLFPKTLDRLHGFWPGAICFSCGHWLRYHGANELIKQCYLCQTETNE